MEPVLPLLASQMVQHRLVELGLRGYERISEAGKDSMGAVAQQKDEQVLLYHMTMAEPSRTPNFTSSLPHGKNTMTPQ